MEKLTVNPLSLRDISQLHSLARRILEKYEYAADKMLLRKGRGIYLLKYSEPSLPFFSRRIFPLSSSETAPAVTGSYTHLTLPTT